MVHNGGIAYREQDSISVGVSFGYKTLFACYAEHCRSPTVVQRSAVEAQAAIIINCGRFSYASVPQQYDFILGVSGTLETLSEPERGIITNVAMTSRSTRTHRQCCDAKFYFAQDKDTLIVPDDEHNDPSGTNRHR